MQGQHDGTVRQMQSQIDQIKGEFCEYRRAKHQEICGLDARIRKLLKPQTLQPCDVSNKKTMSHKIPVSQATSVEACATKDTEKLLCQTLPSGSGEPQHTFMGDGILSMTTPAAPVHCQSLQQVPSLCYCWLLPP